MKALNLTSSAVCLALAVVQTVVAGTDIFFVPLTESAAVTLPDSNEEIIAPWVVPAGVTQRTLTSMVEIEGDIRQSVLRTPGAGTSGSMWDMVSFDRSGKNIFIPHETPWGAGGSRYNIARDKNEVLFSGDSGGMVEDWSSDWGAFDPSTYTPNGTVFFAEEWTGEGRVIEVLNPLANVNNIRIRELNTIPNVAHEGLRFSRNAKTLYFVDEWNSGSIYKLRFRNKNRYTRGGQTFVLRVDAFNGDPEANFDEGDNASKTRVGRATWAPITDKDGIPLTISNPYRDGPTDDPRTNPETRGGRAAADEANGTPYGRPEDIEVGKLKNGRTVIYFAATSEQTVYSVEELGNGKAMVRVFAGESAPPKNLGFPPTTGILNSPDNLAQDAVGNIFVIEDAPNSSETGGDVWFARDTNGDGVAESLDHFMSIRVDGSEATGMIFDPAKPTRFVAAVQHPDSTDIPGGTGDALWIFNVKDVEPPAACEPGSTNSGCNYVRLLREAIQ